MCICCTYTSCAHAGPEVDARWTHEYVPSAAPSRIFGHAKDFAMSPNVDPDAGETQPGSCDGL